MREKVRIFIERYKYALVFCYIPFYFIWFSALEKRTTVEFNYMHCVVDDWIPFCEYFIVPYLFWFVYIAVTVIFLLVQTKHPEDFFRCASALIMGMTVCLLVYSFFPNAQSMRPTSFERDNVFTRLVAMIYSTDTSTNVFPSIHVYNSLAIHMALCKSNALQGRKGWKTASLIVCMLICISTMALKQHSFMDVVAAGLLYLIIYKIVYRPTNLSTKFYPQHQRD